MQDRKLLEVTVITDDDTGCYGVGDLDFGVPVTTRDWLDADPDRAPKLAAHLRWLADAVEHRTSPFDSWQKPAQPSAPPVARTGDAEGEGK